MLTVAACVKMVKAELVPDSQPRPGAYVLNPYDLYMLERLLDMKNEFPLRLIGVSMGPRDCVAQIAKLAAMGLDKFYLISDSAFSGSDTYSTSYILTKALGHIGNADIYAFGEKSLDGETGQVPIGVSAGLGLTCYTGVESLKPLGENKILLNCTTPRVCNTVEALLPVSVCFKGFTTKSPGISLIKLKQFRNFSPIILDAEAFAIEKQYCGQSGSKTRVSAVNNIISKRQPKWIEGNIEEKIGTLENLISKRGIYR
jgi:electron transfer flavoprotein beta subunit